MKIEEQIDILIQQVHAERQGEIDFYQQKIASLSISDKKKAGYTWYPVDITKSGFAIGDFSFVQVEIPAPKAHQFRSGHMVRLYSLLEGEGAEMMGSIKFVTRQRMRIFFRQGHLPDWLHKGMIGVDLLFDERTFDEMERALKVVKSIDKGPVANLKKVFFGNEAPQLNQYSYQNIKLNDSQNFAIGSMLGNKELSIIHGPPGTGKTTTLVAVIQSLIKNKERILVCAASNSATDLMTLRMKEKGVNVVRVGNITRIDEGIIDSTLDAKVANHPDSKRIKKIKIEAEQSRKLAQKYKRNFDANARMERKQLYQTASELKAWAAQLEERVVGQILEDADVITTTLVGAANSLLHQQSFTCLLIDEAAQALEPACWIPIVKAQKVIMAGDPLQLPPTIKSTKAQKLGMGITQMERLMKKHPDAVNLLNTQYRMNDAIMQFSNAYFYNGELQSGDGVGEAKLANDSFTALEFIDTAGCGFEEKKEDQNYSKYNPDEFNILREHLYQSLANNVIENHHSIGIISPYKKQVLWMQDDYKVDEQLEGLDITIDTIDAFQGQERDVIYISLVRSNEKGEIGFLKDYRRLNVALTRAKKKLVVVGDSATIGLDKFFSSFIDYVEKSGSYRSAWEFMV